MRQRDSNVGRKEAGPQGTGGSASKSLAQRDKENTAAEVGMGLTVRIVRELQTTVQEMCTKHRRNTEQLLAQLPETSELRSGDNEGLAPIEETDEEDTYRQQKSEQDEQATLAKLLKSCIAATLVRDAEIVAKLVGSISQLASESEFTKSNDEQRLTSKKLALLQQENEEMRRLLALKDAGKGEASIAANEPVVRLLQEVEQLKRQVALSNERSEQKERNEAGHSAVAGLVQEVAKLWAAHDDSETVERLQKANSTLRHEKETLAQQHRTLASSLAEVQDAMELLEHTNQDLLRRLEAAETVKADLRASCQELQQEARLKNEALDKAQHVIQQLYQENEGLKSQPSFHNPTPDTCLRSTSCPNVIALSTHAPDLQNPQPYISIRAEAEPTLGPTLSLSADHHTARVTTVDEMVQTCFDTEGEQSKPQLPRHSNPNLQGSPPPNSDNLRRPLVSGRPEDLPTNSEANTAFNRYASTRQDAESTERTGNQEVTNSATTQLHKLQQELEEWQSKVAALQLDHENALAAVKRAAANTIMQLENRSELAKQKQKQKQKSLMTTAEKNTALSPIKEPSESPALTSQCIITTLSAVKCSVKTIPEAPATPVSVSSMPAVSSESHVSLLQLVLNELEAQYGHEYGYRRRFEGMLSAKLEEHKVATGDTTVFVQTIADALGALMSRNEQLTYIARECYPLLGEQTEMVRRGSEDVAVLTKANNSYQEELEARKDAQDKLLYDHQAELCDLKRRNEELVTSLQESRTQLRILEQSRQTTASAIQDAQRRLTSLQDWQEELAAVLRADVTQPQTLVQNAKELQAAKSQFDVLAGELAHEKKVALEDAERHRTELQHERENSERMDALLKEKERMVFTLREELDQLRTRVERQKLLRSELEAKDEQLQTLANEGKKLGTLKQELETECQRLQQRLLSLEEKAERDKALLRDQMDEQSDSVLYFKTCVQQQELEIKNLQLHLDNAKEAAAKEWQQELETLQASLETAKRNYQDAMKLVKVKDDANAQLQDQVRKLEEEKRALERATASRLQEEVSGLKAKQISTSHDLDNAHLSRRTELSFCCPDPHSSVSLSAEVKTLTMILAEKNNYILQLEEQNNELRTMYEQALKQQLDTEEGLLSRIAGGDTSIATTPCTECSRLQEHVHTIDQKQEKHKQKYSKRVQEFEAILKYIERSLKLKLVPSADRSQDPGDLGKYIAKLGSRNPALKKWLQDIVTLIDSSALQQRRCEARHYEFLRLVLNALEAVTHRQRLQESQERMKGSSTSRNEGLLNEIERVLIDELQIYMKAHTKCYLPLYHHS